MIRKVLVAGLASAVLATTTLALSQPANARARHMGHGKMAKVRLVPSQQKASYHMVAAGPLPMLVEVQQVPPGGGALGLGLAPSTGLFKTVPVLGDLGL